MLKGKILYFDYWTAGINNFLVFDRHLKSHEIETKLLHVGSWRGLNCPGFEEIQGIKCYDIKYFGTNSLFRILENERPDVVVMLNCSQITDRTIILSCKKLNIKSVYLMHGSLIREDFIDETVKSINKTLRRNWIKRSLKHFKGTIQNYLNSLFRYDWKYIFRLHGYRILFKTFWSPGIYLNFPPPSFDLSPDLALVYGAIDEKFYSKQITDLCSKIKVVGNPYLDDYFLQLPTLGEGRDPFLSDHNISLDKPFITYVEEGLVEDKFWDNESRLNFINEINSACQEIGLHLVIKLHPRTARGDYFDSIKDLKGITILSQVNFPKLIYFSEKCVSHYSTTLVYPFLMMKPILVPRWGKSSKLLTIYDEKEVTYVKSLMEFKSFLKKSDFHYERERYLNDHIPFKDGKTSERIANHLTEIMH